MKDDKREIILQAALKLFVSDGFDGTSTAKIATKAKVSNGALFHYFKTREELIVALYINLKEQLNKAIFDEVVKATTYKEKYRANFRASLAWALENSDGFVFILQMHLTPHIKLVPSKVKEEQTRLHNEMLRDAFKANTFNKSLTPEFVAIMKSNQINGVFNYLRNTSVSVAKRTKLIDDIFEAMWKTLERSSE